MSAPVVASEQQQTRPPRSTRVSHHKSQAPGPVPMTAKRQTKGPQVGPSPRLAGGTRQHDSPRTVIGAPPPGQPPQMAPWQMLPGQSASEQQAAQPPLGHFFCPAFAQPDSRRTYRWCRFQSSNRSPGRSSGPRPGSMSCSGSRRRSRSRQPTYRPPPRCGNTPRSGKCRRRRSSRRPAGRVTQVGGAADVVAAGLGCASQQSFPQACCPSGQPMHVPPMHSWPRGHQTVPQAFSPRVQQMHAASCAGS